MASSPLQAAVKSSANDTQVGGAHYRTSIQHWDMVTVYNLGYLEGQVSKYITRWRKKNGAQDLEKARHFLLKLIEVRRAGLHVAGGRVAADGYQLDAYASANELGTNELAVLQAVLWSATYPGRTSGVLESAVLVVDSMLRELATSEPGEPTSGYVHQD